MSTKYFLVHLKSTGGLSYSESKKKGEAVVAIPVPWKYIIKQLDGKKSDQTALDQHHPVATNTTHTENSKITALKSFLDRRMKDLYTIEHDGDGHTLAGSLGQCNKQGDKDAFQKSRDCMIRLEAIIKLFNKTQTVMKGAIDLFLNELTTFLRFRDVPTPEEWIKFMLSSSPSSCPNEYSELRTWYDKQMVETPSDIRRLDEFFIELRVFHPQLSRITHAHANFRKYAFTRFSALFSGHGRGKRYDMWTFLSLLGAEGHVINAEGDVESHISYSGCAVYRRLAKEMEFYLGPAEVKNVSDKIQQRFKTAVTNCSPSFSSKRKADINEQTPVAVKKVSLLKENNDAEQQHAPHSSSSSFADNALNNSSAVHYSSNTEQPVTAVTDVFHSGKEEADPNPNHQQEDKSRGVKITPDAPHFEQDERVVHLNTSHVGPNGFGLLICTHCGSVLASYHPLCAHFGGDSRVTTTTTNPTSEIFLQLASGNFKPLRNFPF